MNSFKDLAKACFSDIRFWILIFFLLRLYGITNPPLEVGHNWRQVTTNMYARNFLEIDANILYARVDMAGAKSGITAKEFPVFNYLIFIVAKTFGYDHWYGRLINLVISSIGIFYFFLILKRFFNKDIALIAGILLICSVWFDNSRKIIPDTFSTSLVIISIYYALEYLYKSKVLHLILFFLIATIAVLSKIPVIILLSTLLIPVFDSRVRIRSKIVIIIAGSMTLALTVLWYYYWVPHIVETYGFEHHYFRGLGEGVKEILDDIPRLLERFYYTAFMGFTAFILFIAGFIFAVKKNQKLMLNILAVIFIPMMVFIFKAGITFYLHNYYIVPIVPVMAIFAAYAVYLIPKSWIRIAIICIAVFEGIANQQHDFRLKDSELYKLKLETVADNVSDEGDLIIINGGSNPQHLYFTHRKGWTVDIEKIISKNELDQMIKKGAQYLFIDKHYINDSEIDLKYSIEYEDNNFIVYNLSH